jgi:hypothetical protein
VARSEPNVRPKICWDIADLDAHLERFECSEQYPIVVKLWCRTASERGPQLRCNTTRCAACPLVEPVTFSVTFLHKYCGLLSIQTFHLDRVFLFLFRIIERTQLASRFTVYTRYISGSKELFEGQVSSFVIETTANPRSNQLTRP